LKKLFWKNFKVITDIAMLVFFLCFRLLSSSVLVLSNREGYRDSEIVVSYMTSKVIPRENWKHYQDWINGDFCNEEGGEKKPFTRVYLWEDRWINWKVEEDKLFNKLEACKDIIEINIDGGHYRDNTKNYAQFLVNKLKETKKTTLTITWYDNAVFGMNWLLGLHADTKKFIWTKEKDHEKTVEHPVQQETYTNFYKKMTSEVCDQNGECFGILAAYSSQDVLCEHIVDEKLLPKCEAKYSEYMDLKDITTSVEPLVEYLKTLKIVKRMDQKVEL